MLIRQSLVIYKARHLPSFRTGIIYRLATIFRDPPIPNIFITPVCPLRCYKSQGVGVCKTKIFGPNLNINFRESFRSEEHTSELQSRGHLVCRLLLEKKKINRHANSPDSDITDSAACPQ